MEELKEATEKERVFWLDKHKRIKKEHKIRWIAFIIMCIVDSVSSFVLLPLNIISTVTNVLIISMMLTFILIVNHILYVRIRKIIYERVEE
jgi:hypothetical protein